jgi:NADH-quinone oxidoreductase subunit J
MVLFIFVVMMLNLGEAATEREGRLLSPGMWAGPALLALVLLIELVVAMARGKDAFTSGGGIGPKEVAFHLFGPYVLGVELASFLLLAGLVGAYYLGIRARRRGGAA